MKFEVSVHSLDAISADCAVVFAVQTEQKKKSTFSPLINFRSLDTVFQGELTRICQLEQFTGAKKQIVTYYPGKESLIRKILIVGLGKADTFVVNDLRNAIGNIAKKIHHDVGSLLLSLPEDKIVGITLEEAAHTITEGILLGSYEFSKYKKAEKKEHMLETVIISYEDKKKHAVIRNAIDTATLFAQATRIARDLVNEQPAVATPTHLANLAKDIAKSSPEITCRIIDKEEAEKLGMQAFLGIARAADTPPKFIFLTYAPKKTKSKRKIALVGKGITFDSGGINLKPSNHIQEMKMDMAGAATVLGVFSVLPALKPQMTVLGLIAATPNLISGSSIVPGDIVQAMNGKTIEVLNTDAEGRVTMADSISFAVKEGATEIIDFATLTGACIVALGDDYAGLFPNNQDLATRIKAAAHEAGEKVWELPMDPDYKELNKSAVADIANIPSSPYGGAITAGLFLEAFVDDIPFVHLDIAGPAFSTKGTDISPKGGTGFGVRLALAYLTGKEEA